MCVFTVHLPASSDSRNKRDVPYRQIWVDSACGLRCLFLYPLFSRLIKVLVLSLSQSIFLSVL